MYYLFTFRSRSGAMKFAENVKREGCSAFVVSTPQSISNGCGLSVKTFDLSSGKRILFMGKYPTFNGAYAVSDHGGAVNIVKK